MIKNMGVRTKILLVFAIPMFVVLLQTGWATYGLYSDYTQAQQIENVGKRSAAGAALSRGLQWERSLTILAMGARSPEQKAGLLAQRDKIVGEMNKHKDIAFEDYHADSIGEATSVAFKETDGLFERIGKLRAEVNAGKLTPEQIQARYDALIVAIATVPSIMANDVKDSNLAALLRAYSNIEYYADYTWREAMAVMMAASAPEAVPMAKAGVINATAYQEQYRFANDQLQRSNKRVVAIPRAEKEILKYRQAVLDAPPGQQVAVDPAAYLKVFESRYKRLGITGNASAEALVNRAAHNAAEARTWLLLCAALAIGVLVVCVLTAWILARSFTRRLTRLTGAAENLREVLPKMGQMLREGQEGVDTPEIPSRSNDEVGRLAKAFNSLSATTVNSFTEQAEMQKSISSMFISIARRDQVLLGRQLAFLDDLEQNETNQENLNKLFSLDHLATRMRRNAESLLVLAGIETGRRPRKPMAMSDVVRVAASEIEDYERVECNVDTDAKIHGRHALSAAHLLAELLENGCRFSNPGTRVYASIAVQSPVVRVQITDSGIGMGPDELRAASECIASASSSAYLRTDKLGLFVVGRLARNLGVDVRISSEQNSGSVVTVEFPESLFESICEPETSAQNAAAAQTSGVIEQNTPELAAVGASAGEMGAHMGAQSQAGTPDSSGSAQPPAQFDFARSEPAGAQTFTPSNGAFGGQLDPGALHGATGSSDLPPPMPAGLDHSMLEEQTPYQPETNATVENSLAGTTPRGSNNTEQPAQAPAPGGEHVGVPAAPTPVAPGGADPMVLEQLGAQPPGPSTGAHAAVPTPEPQPVAVEPAPTFEPTMPAQPYVPTVGQEYAAPAQPVADAGWQPQPQAAAQPPAAPVQPEYVQPEYVQPQAAAQPPAAPVQPEYVQPEYVQPQAAAQPPAAPVQPEYAQPGYPQPEYVQPGYVQPQAAAQPPAPAAPAQPEYAHPEYAQPGYPQPHATAQPPAPAQPEYAQPEYANPEYAQPQAAAGQLPANPQEWQQGHAPAEEPDAQVFGSASFEESMRTLESAPMDALNPVERPQQVAKPQTILPTSNTPTVPASAPVAPPAEGGGLKKLFGRLGGRGKPEETGPANFDDVALPAPGEHPPAAAHPSVAPAAPAQPAPLPPIPTTHQPTPPAPQPPPVPQQPVAEPATATEPAPAAEPGAMPMDLLASDRLAYGQRPSGGIGDTLRQRSELASQALAELSMLSSYAPEAAGGGDTSTLARRERGASDLPEPTAAAPQTPQRPRNAAAVRSTMSNFTSGSKRGRKR